MRRNRKPLKLPKIFEKIAYKQNSLNFNRKRKKIDKDRVLSISIWVIEVAFVIILAISLSYFLGMQSLMRGISMEKTVPENSKVLINRASYSISSPDRGDIVAFYPGGNVNSFANIKRVVGIPGDTVQISKGDLYINGEKTNYVADFSDITYPGLAEDLITLDSGQYFVIGDNYEESTDSRYESIGNISEDAIIGKVWFIITRDRFGPVL